MNPHDMLDELNAFLGGERNRCFSEVEGLLYALQAYLTLDLADNAYVDNGVDMVAENQLELEFAQVGTAPEAPKEFTYTLESDYWDDYLAQEGVFKHG